MATRLSKGRPSRATRIKYDILDDTGEIVEDKMADAGKENDRAETSADSQLSLSNFNEVVGLEEGDMPVGPMRSEAGGSASPVPHEGLDEVFRASIGVEVNDDRGPGKGVEARMQCAQGEHARLVTEAQELARLVEVEAQERTNRALLAQIKTLADKRKEAQLGSPVVMDSLLENSAAFKALRGSIDFLGSETMEKQKQSEMAANRQAMWGQYQKELQEARQKHAQMHASLQQITQELHQQQLQQQRALQEQQEEFSREMTRRKEEHAERMKLELARLEEAQAQEREDRIAAEKKQEEQREREAMLRRFGKPELLDSDLDPEMVMKVLQWQARSADSGKGREPSLVTDMVDPANRYSCLRSGVSKLKNLELIEDPTKMDLTRKTEQAIAMALQHCQEEDGEGESLCKKRKLQSGLDLKSSHKVKVEVEWAQHNMGREFEANPLSVTQMRFEHYVLGEVNIIRECKQQEQVEKRLCLLARIAYWRIKYDWPLARNIYVALLRDIEVGRYSWADVDLNIYKEMLEGNRIGGGNMPTKEEASKRRPRDVWFCAAYQKGECKMESPHSARIGQDDRIVQHICSSCWLRDGKKLPHPNGGGGCPRAKTA